MEIAAPLESVWYPVGGCAGGGGGVGNHGKTAP